MIVLIQFFDRGVLRSEAASGRGVHHKDHLSAVIAETQFYSLSGCDSVIIDYNYSSVFGCMSSHGGKPFCKFLHERFLFRFDRCRIVPDLRIADDPR